MQRKWQSDENYNIKLKLNIKSKSLLELLNKFMCILYSLLSNIILNKNLINCISLL